MPSHMYTLSIITNSCTPAVRQLRAITAQMPHSWRKQLFKKIENHLGPLARAGTAAAPASRYLHRGCQNRLHIASNMKSRWDKYYLTWISYLTTYVDHLAAPLASRYLHRGCPDRLHIASNMKSRWDKYYLTWISYLTLYVAHLAAPLASRNLHRGCPDRLHIASNMKFMRDNIYLAWIS